MGRFIPLTEILCEVGNHVARCVGLPEANANENSGSRPTLYRHQHLVLEYVGVSRWNASAQRQVENTTEALAAVRTYPADLLNGAIEMLLRERIELPALSTLRRIAENVVLRVHNRLLLEFMDGNPSRTKSHWMACSKFLPMSMNPCLRCSVAHRAARLAKTSEN